MLSHSERVEPGSSDTTHHEWIGPTLERVAKSFSTIAPSDGGRTRKANAFKIEWPPDVLLSDKMIEREDHEAAAQLLRDYSHGYGNLGTVGGYGESTNAPHAGMIFDKRLGAVTHRKGTDLTIRMKRRQQFDDACRYLQSRAQGQLIAGLTAICGLSPLDGSPYMTFTRLGQWWVPPVTNPAQLAMAGKLLVKTTCETLRKHYDAT